MKPRWQQSIFEARELLQQIRKREINLHALIVEDDPVDRSDLSGLLEDCDIHPRCFSTAELALGHLEDEQYRIALVNLKLPGMDGFTFISELYRKLPTLPVAIVTGYDDDELRRKAQALGVLHWFTKPFDILNLTKLLTDLRIIEPANDKERNRIDGTNA